MFCENLFLICTIKIFDIDIGFFINIKFILKLCISSMKNLLYILCVSTSRYSTMMFHGFQSKEWIVVSSDVPLENKQLSLIDAIVHGSKYFRIPQRNRIYILYINDPIKILYNIETWLFPTCYNYAIQKKLNSQNDFRQRLRICNIPTNLHVRNKSNNENRSQFSEQKKNSNVHSLSESISIFMLTSFDSPTLRERNIQQPRAFSRYAKRYLSIDEKKRAY